MNLLGTYIEAITIKMGKLNITSTGFYVFLLWAQIPLLHKKQARLPCLLSENAYLVKEFHR